MSANNWMLTQKKAADMTTKSFTTSSGVITYTAKTGRTEDGFQFDSVIRVTTTSTYSLTITVPDGVFYGQQLFILFEVEGGTETVDVTTTTGDDATQITAAGGYWLGIWCGSTIGWTTLDSSTT